MLREKLHYDIPVIIISTLDKGDVIARNLGLKNIDFMSKPIHTEDLIQKINTYSKK
jgi:response regulator of citrate/malate metabolism